METSCETRRLDSESVGSATRVIKRNADLMMVRTGTAGPTSRRLPPSLGNCHPRIIRIPHIATTSSDGWLCGRLRIGVLASTVSSYFLRLGDSAVTLSLGSPLHTPRHAPANRPNGPTAGHSEGTPSVAGSHQLATSHVSVPRIPAAGLPVKNRFSMPGCRAICAWRNLGICCPALTTCSTP